MNRIKKHCDTCLYAYLEKTLTSMPMEGTARQLCRNAVYHSSAYTQKMLMEDWGKGFCRLWTPRTRKGN